MAFTGMDPDSDEFRTLAAGFRQRDARESVFCADPRCGALVTAANDFKYDGHGRKLHRACEEAK
jgi:hypothetical protein